MEINITPGIIFLIVGVWLLYWVGRRRFRRRGPSGLQQFSSYSRALVVVVVERIAKVLGWVLIIAGLLWFLYVWELRKRREKDKAEQQSKNISLLRISTDVYKC